MAHAYEEPAEIRVAAVKKRKPSLGLLAHIFWLRLLIAAVGDAAQDPSLLRWRVVVDST